MKKIKVGNEEEKIVPVTTNPILTQKLNDWTPKCTVMFSLIFFGILAALFVVFGIAIVVETGKIREYSVTYTSW